MKDEAFQSASELSEAIRNRRLGSLELLEIYIDRFKKFNPAINAVVATDFENARKRAKQADEALTKGENWGPLHGLPITVKDSYATVGLPSTSGSPDLKDHIPQKNAAVVEAVINMGAIVFGKTNLPLFAMDFQSYNDVYGQTNNPWNLERIPGGSSGGAAAALAAGLTSFEIGSDIGGSIRNPAHFCGVYGHKSSWGIVPLNGHIPPPPGIYPGEYMSSTDLAACGPLARSAKDLELLMDVMVKPSTPEQTAFQIRLPQPRKSRLKDYKIGIWLDDTACPVDSQVGDQLQNAVDQLTKAGANIIDQHPNIDFKRCHEVYSLLLHGATCAGLPPEVYSGLADEAKELKDSETGPRVNVVRGSTQDHRNWQLIDYERTIMRQNWADFFKEYDLLLCPVVPVTAFPHDHSDFFDRVLKVNGIGQSYIDTMIGWAGLVGVSYLPSTVMPIGMAKDGLPVGMQIVGPYLEDLTPINAAQFMSEIVGGFVPPPGYI